MLNATGARLGPDDILNLCDTLMAARDSYAWGLSDHRRLSLSPHSVRWIVGKVAARFGVTDRDVLGYGRTHPTARARQVAMFLCHELTDGSKSAIARMFHRDPSTVVHACAQVAVRDRYDPGTRRMLAELRKELLT